MVTIMKKVRNATLRMAPSEGSHLPCFKLTMAVVTVIQMKTSLKM